VADIALHVVDDRPRASVIIHAPPKGKLAMSGDGPDRLVCGNCSATLAQGVDEGQLVGTLVQCPECGAFNEPNA
jgi:ribosomal protein S27AE